MELFFKYRPMAQNCEFIEYFSLFFLGGKKFLTVLAVYHY